MDTPAHEVPLDDDQSSEGFPLENAELRHLRSEIDRVKRLLVQMANQIAAEESRRQVADAQRDQQLRIFMLSMQTAIQAFLTHQEVDQEIRIHLDPGSLNQAELDSDDS